MRDQVQRGLRILELGFSLNDFGIVSAHLNNERAAKVIQLVQRINTLRIRLYTFSPCDLQIQPSKLKQAYRKRKKKSTCFYNAPRISGKSSRNFTNTLVTLDTKPCLRDDTFAAWISPSLTRL